MILNTANTQIGIELVDFYVPETSHSAGECLNVPALGLTDARLPVIWNWTKDPDSLLRFFSSEASALRRDATDLTPGDVTRFSDNSGIERIFSAAGESCSDMACKVAGQLIARRPELKKTVNAIVCFHSTLNEEPNSSLAGRLQFELGIKGAAAFAIGQKSGTASIMALKVACHMMMAEPDLDTFLLVGAEKIVQPYRRFFKEVTLISDSASAMLVRRQSDLCRLLCLNINDFAPEFCDESRDQAVSSEMINRFFSEKAAATIEQTLSALGLELRDVALVLAPNFNLSMVHDLKVRAAIPPEKIWAKNLPKHGYLMSSDVAANLATAMKDSSIKRGDVVLALGLGLDFSVGCVALQA